MPGSTTDWALPYPLYTDPAAGAAQLQALAEAIDDAHEQIAAEIAAIGQRTAAAVYGSAAQSLANNTSVQLTFSTTEFDNGLTVNLGTGDLTVVTPGWYWVSAWVRIAANSTGNRQIYIRQDTSPIGYLRSQTVASPDTTVLTANALTFFTAGQSINMQAAQDSGGALNATNRRLAAVRVA
jgi:hypothetical protein